MILDSFTLKNISLSNKIVMAPVTRSRAIDNTPNKLMATYYSQRASAGLIITEGTSPSPSGLGYARIPGAFTDNQIEGWKHVFEEVHAQGGKIFVQLMHCGRISAKENLPEGSVTIAPSAVLAAGEMYTDTAGMVAHDVPKEMTAADIKEIQQDYVNAAKRLIEAGADGVELHAANGYLFNQFLNPKSNIRTDNYGGSFENRSRFILDTARAVVEVVGASKVGVRFSPYGAFNDLEPYHADVEAQFSYLAQELKKIDIAYIHIVDQRVAFAAPDFKTDIINTIKSNFGGTIISGGNVDSLESAEKVIQNGADLVYVGRPFIANPDFVYRIKNDLELNQPNPDTFYTPGKEGYTDYNVVAR